MKGYLRALEIKRKYYGDDHVEYANILQNIAEVFIDMKKFYEAENYLKKT
jgi:hypothetical protein